MFAASLTGFTVGSVVMVDGIYIQVKVAHTFDIYNL